MTISTSTTTTKTPEAKKEQRVCSQCGKGTRLHKWSKMRADGVVPEYEQWYDDHQGGFFCYSCFMKKYWAKRKWMDKKQEQERRRRRSINKKNEALTLLQMR